MKKTFSIPVYWEMGTRIFIEANTPEEALKIFQKNQSTMSLPEYGEYIENSFGTDDDVLIEKLIYEVNTEGGGSK